MAFMSRLQHAIPFAQPKFREYEVYETPDTIYLVAKVSSVGVLTATMYKVINIDRSWDEPYPLSALLSEDASLYDGPQLAKLREKIGILRRTRGVGVLGITRFLRGYSLVLITQRRVVGTIGGHVIYAVESTVTIPISRYDNKLHSGKKLRWLKNKLRFKRKPLEVAEDRYQQIFKASIQELATDFYFSYTYDVSNSLQHNMLSASADAEVNVCRTQNMLHTTSRCVWNHQLGKEYRQLLKNRQWWLPVCHGSAQQRRCLVNGNEVSITLLARRSWHHAGTRYLKRGANTNGDVANDVEIEQIVDDLHGHYSSFLHVRGSIPIFWTQEPSPTVVRPPINIRSSSSHEYRRGRLHFADMFSRYAAPCICLNLVKKRKKNKKEREHKIGKAFKKLVDQMYAIGVPRDLLKYHHLDITSIIKSKDDTEGLKLLFEANIDSLKQTGFFCTSVVQDVGKWDFAPHTHHYELKERDRKDGASSPPPRHTFYTQKGILRVNCIDCLDRTNLAQKTTGIHVLGMQMFALGLLPRVRTFLNDHSRFEGDDGHFNYHCRIDCVKVLKDMYDHVGNRIANQYGGSAAHNKLTGKVSATVDANDYTNKNGDEIDKKKTKKAKKMNSFQKLSGKANKIGESIRRHYNNSFHDLPKQDGFNLFLGHFSDHLRALVASGRVDEGASSRTNIPSAADSLPGELHLHLWELHAEKHKNGSLHHDYYLHNKATLSPDYIAKTQGNWWEKAIDKFDKRCTPAHRLSLARCHMALLLPEPLVTQPGRIRMDLGAEAPEESREGAEGNPSKWNPSIVNTIMSKRDAVLMAKCGLAQLWPDKFTSFDDLLKVKGREQHPKNWSAPRIRRGGSSKKSESAPSTFGEYDMSSHQGITYYKEKISLGDKNLFKEYVEVPPTDVDSFQFNNVRKDAHRALGKAKKVFDSYQRSAAFRQPTNNAAWSRTTRKRRSDSVEVMLCLQQDDFRSFSACYFGSLNKAVRASDFTDYQQQRCNTAASFQSHLEEFTRDAGDVTHCRECMAEWGVSETLKRGVFKGQDKIKSLQDAMLAQTSSGADLSKYTESLQVVSQPFENLKMSATSKK